VPDAVFILIFDMSCIAGDVLLSSHPLRGCHRSAFGREGLGEDITELIGPSTVMRDNLVVNFDQGSDLDKR